MALQIISLIGSINIGITLLVGAFMGRPSRDGGAASRRSRDDDRYDADPELLSDDFAGMRFHQDGSTCPVPSN